MQDPRTRARVFRMEWRCYAWTGTTLPTEQERADPTSQVPPIHPREWLNKSALYEAYETAPGAVGWFRNLMNRAGVDHRQIIADVTANNIIHGADVSSWVKLRDGIWLSWAVLAVLEGSHNGLRSHANA